MQCVVGGQILQTGCIGIKDQDPHIRLCGEVQYFDPFGKQARLQLLLIQLFGSYSPAGSEAGASALQ